MYELRLDPARLDSCARAFPSALRALAQLEEALRSTLEPNRLWGAASETLSVGQRATRLREAGRLGVITLTDVGAYRDSD